MGRKLRGKCDRDRQGTDSDKKTSTTTKQKSHGQKKTATKTRKKNKTTKNRKDKNRKDSNKDKKRQIGEVCSAPPAYEADN